MEVERLWSEDDEDARHRFAVAVDAEDLLEALCAIEGAPLARRDEARSCLVGWAARTASFLQGGLSPVAALGETLVTEAGFAGDRESYFAPENSWLTRVIERRRGLPILLSSVWMIVGGTAGLAVEGVALPGHFVIRVEGETVDPFHGGRSLAVDDCRTLVATVTGGAISWSDDLLEACATSTLLERVLRNLMREHARQGDGAALFREATFLRELLPDDPAVHLSRADLAARLGDRAESRLALATVVEKFPGTEAAELAHNKLAAIGAPN